MSVEMSSRMAGYVPRRTWRSPGTRDRLLFFANILLAGVFLGGCINLVLMHLALDARYTDYGYALFDALNWQLLAYPGCFGVVLLATVIFWLVRWNGQQSERYQLVVWLARALTLGIPLGIWLNLRLVSWAFEGVLLHNPVYSPERYPLLIELQMRERLWLITLALIAAFWLVVFMLRRVSAYSRP